MYPTKDGERAQVSGTVTHAEERRSACMGFVERMCRRTAAMLRPSDDSPIYSRGSYLPPKSTPNPVAQGAFKFSKRWRAFFKFISLILFQAVEMELPLQMIVCPVRMQARHFLLITLAHAVYWFSNTTSDTTSIAKIRLW